MTTLDQTTPDDEIEHGTCPHCDTAMSIPCASIVDSMHKLRSLLDGGLNTATCQGCYKQITAQEPVFVNLEIHGLEQMIFMPLSYLERGFLPAEELAAPGKIGRIFFSLDELARQVRARIIIHQLRLDV
jgi:hypothetical protein